MEVIPKWLFTLAVWWIALNVVIAAMLYGIGSSRRRGRKARMLSHIKALYGLHYRRKKLLRWGKP